MERRSSRGSRPKAPPTGSALDCGLRLLARRPHSRLELRQKLAELGYVDDGAFARGLVRRRSAVRGPRALAGELSARGIDRAGIAEALEGLDEQAELAAATRLAERLYAERPLPGYKEVLDRVGSRLMRRGFSAVVVRAACRAVLAGGPSA